MRAAVCRSYGPPDVVVVEEIPAPHISSGELLIRVTSSTVNRTTSCIRIPKPRMAVRLLYGLRRPRRPVLGTDFAGVVAAVGDDVDTFEVGDRVFGFDDTRMGAHGEFLALPASAGVFTIPDEVTDDEAAAAVEGAHYSLAAIHRASLSPGQRALVYGGGGAIGSSAIQFLVDRGVDVVAVAEARQLALMEQLGASRAIDFRAEDFTRIGETFDLVFDAVGKTSFDECEPLLSPHGCFISSELGARLENLRLAVTTRFGNGPRVYFPVPRKLRSHLATTRSALRAGSLRPVIDRTFELDEIVDAYRYVETETKTGSVVLRVSAPVVPRPVAD